MAASRTLRRQARAEATLRTAPEASVLREMLMQAMSDRDTAIAAATGAARGVTSAVNKAGPSLKKAYGAAIDESHGTTATVDATLSQMGASAGPVQAAMARERGAGAERLSASLASALSELSNRRVEAAAGRAQATNAALSEYGSTKDKLTRQALDLSDQAGLYASTRYGELTGEERKAKRDAHQKAVDRRFTARQKAADRENSRLTSGVDAQGHVIPGGPKDAKGKAAKPLTAAEQRTRGEKLAVAKSQSSGRHARPSEHTVSTGRAPTRSSARPQSGTIRIRTAATPSVASNRREESILNPKVRPLFSVVIVLPRRKVVALRNGTCGCWTLRREPERNSAPI